MSGPQRFLRSWYRRSPFWVKVGEEKEENNCYTCNNSYCKENQIISGNIQNDCKDWKPKDEKDCRFSDCSCKEEKEEDRELYYKKFEPDRTDVEQIRLLYCDKYVYDATHDRCKRHQYCPEDCDYKTPRKNREE